MKVISGGQTGADVAGLKAAKACGLETGGHLPSGCRTLDGPKPEMLTEYNMTEHSSPSYAIRTELNVKNSDGTIRFAKTFSSAGEKCTLRAIKWFNKPYFDIPIDAIPKSEDVISWIEKNQIGVLNIAGNAEQTAPGIEKIVFDYLFSVFSQLKKDGLDTQLERK